MAPGGVLSVWVWRPQVFSQGFSQDKSDILKDFNTMFSTVQKFQYLQWPGNVSFALTGQVSSLPALKIKVSGVLKKQKNKNKKKAHALIS